MKFIIVITQWLVTITTNCRAVSRRMNAVVCHELGSSVLCHVYSANSENV
jgi:hypothetical protein